MGKRQQLKSRYFKTYQDWKRSLSRPSFEFICEHGDSKAHSDKSSCIVCGGRMVKVEESVQG